MCCLLERVSVWADVEVAESGGEEEGWVVDRELEPFVGDVEGPLDLKTYKDEYQEGLKQIIDAKIAGREVVAPDVEEPPKVVNLMEALRKSLDRVSEKKKAPAKATVSEKASAAPKRKRA